MTAIRIVGEPPDPYTCVVNSGAIDITVEERSFVSITTVSGQKLVIFVHDDMFEVEYTGDFGSTGFNAGKTIFRDGFVTRKE